MAMTVATMTRARMVAMATPGEPASAASIGPHAGPSHSAAAAAGNAATTAAARAAAWATCRNDRFMSPILRDTWRGTAREASPAGPNTSVLRRVGPTPLVGGDGAGGT